MFTGLIREIAKVTNFKDNFLTIESKYKPKIGDSIAVNGACLTVVKNTNSTFTVELSPESQNLLALENYKDFVHIEPAMQMGDRFEGHIVQGHVDCIGTIIDIQNNGNSQDFFIKIPKKNLKYIINKGSITIDGISLTVNEIFENSFRLTIIPHTIDNTLFKTYSINSTVNIETDMFARYIYNLFNKKEKPLEWDDIDRTMFRY